MKRLIYVLILLLLMPTIAAKSGSLKLLAVSDDNNKLLGTIADLSLEIEPGNGKVFIDTFPLTKFDTQISTRFGKEIACDLLDVNCHNFNFIYTISSGSTIIGGPSASAAIAALTVMVLDNLQINQEIAITGTINSGGLIGPVGSLKEKIFAASQAGVSKVLISKGSSNITFNNTSFDLIEYGGSLGIEVIEVVTLEDVIFQFTGKKYNDLNGEIEIDSSYTDTMIHLAGILCNRSRELKIKLGQPSDEDNDTIKDIDNLTVKANEAFEKNRYYGSASYCFGANVHYTNLLDEKKNYTELEIRELIQKIDDNLLKINAKVDTIKKNTITDLQAYIIVKERLLEAQTIMDEIRTKNITGVVPDLSYVTERLYTALSWSEFFNKPGKIYTLDNNILRRSCIEKINEANERITFARLIIPSELEEIQNELETAIDYSQKEEYPLCLFKAGKAKARANIILSVLGVSEEQVPSLIENRLEVIKKVIIKTTKKDIFPILGYSYYEYALDLKDQDIHSSLLYLEYALEFSDMDRYFKNDKTILVFDYRGTIIFAVGIILGFIIGCAYKSKDKTHGSSKRTSLGKRGDR